jgi:hypothetical protein
MFRHALAVATEIRALPGQKWPSRSNSGSVPVGVKTPRRPVALRPTTRTCGPKTALTMHHRRRLDHVADGPRARRGLRLLHWHVRTVA